MSSNTSLPYSGQVDQVGLYRAGFFVFGYMTSFVLFGILIMQCFIYHTRFTNDQKWLKIFVWLVVFLECSSFVFTIYEFWLGASLGCLACVLVEDEAAWPLGVVIILAGLIASLVHFFYCWRIWVMGQSLIIPCVVMLVSLIQCLLAICEGSLLIHPDQRRINAVSRAWTVGSCLCDIIITTYTTRLLLGKKSGTQFKRTRFLVVKLVKLTIETGMVTVIATLITAVLLFTNSWAYYAKFTYLSTLYANCLLTNLNARILMQKSYQKYQESTILFDGNGGEIEGANDNNMDATLWPRNNPEIQHCHSQNTLPLERVSSSGTHTDGPLQVCGNRSEDSIPAIVPLPSTTYHDARHWEMRSMP